MDNLSDNIASATSEEKTTAKMEPSTLGGVKGIGTLQVVRGQRRGDVLEILGTWRLEDDSSEQDVSALQRAQESGETVTYKGKLDDPDEPERDEIEVEVKILSVETYTYDGEEEDETGPERTLYNYRLEGSLPYMSEDEDARGNKLTDDS